MRYMDNPNYRNIRHTNVNGEPLDMIHIVSRNQGWITVEPDKNDRKHPLEKKRLGNVKEVNILSPIWMQVRHQKPSREPLKAMAINADSRTKCGRTILVDKEQPVRNVFSFIDKSVPLTTKTVIRPYFDSNWSMQQAIQKVNLTTGPSRLIDWPESYKQPSVTDKQVCAKIGSAHFT